MWRDKESKKIVYLQKVEFCLIDKNGQIKKVFREDKFYNCESWLYGKETTLEELKRLAYWEEEDERD
nr:MAG TPA: hypothetical protein [Caudoviricetes sp.]